jgi:predicted GNAT family acetyltransferase
MGDITVDLYDDATAFATAVGPWLEEHEAENARFLFSLAGMVRDRSSAPLMARTTSGGATTFAALYLKFALIVSRGSDEAVDAAAARLGAPGVNLPGVVGPAREAERFARGWARQRGCNTRLAIDQRIYQLTAVSWPPPIPGEMRALTEMDLELALQWAQAFDAEALLPHERRSAEVARPLVARRIAEGMLFGWWVEGRFVAMAGLTRPTARTISINSVYTPPEHRRRGFATALVAALSAEGLGRGKPACLLYTDLGNPTSNAIYQKIGYRPVCDSRHYLFEPA